MKKNQLLLAAASLIAGSSFGQILTVDSNTDSDSVNCNNHVNLYLHNGPIDDQATVYIDWGDGTPVETSTYAVAGDAFLNDSYSHGYTLAGTYNATIQVHSDVSNANVGSGLQVAITAIVPANCGNVYISTYQQNPSIFYYNAPYDFTDVNGLTTTIVPGYYNYASYGGLNINNGPYTVSLNDSWLASNNLLQVGADFQITFPNGNGTAYPYQSEIEVDCANPAGGPDFATGYATAWNFVAPLQTGHVTINLCNYACSDVSDAQVTLTFPSGLVPLTTGLTNAVVTATTLTFDLIGLEDCEVVNIPFTFPGATPAGTVFNFSATMTGISEIDGQTDNNTIEFVAYVLNSYDPNAKNTNKPAYIDPMTAESIQYDIHFQNDGNLEAYNVVIQDTISPLLDLSTFSVLGAKHPVAYSVNPTTRVVTFSFSNIFLSPSSEDLDASQGFVVYSIKENENLTVGSEINNTAYIYFDFNPAIVTNTTSSINEVLGLNELDEIAVKVYPNPASDVLNIQTEGLQTVKIIDFTGKLILDAGNKSSVHIGNLSNGVYLLQVTTSKGQSTQKLVVRK